MYFLKLKSMDFEWNTGISTGFISLIFVEALNHLTFWQFDYTYHGFQLIVYFPS